MDTNFESLSRGIAATTLATLDQHRSAKQYDSGEDLFRIGEPVEWLSHILVGRAKSWRPLSNGRAVTLAYLAEGSTPGVFACCRGQPSPSTVTAITAIELDRWPATVIRQLLAEDAIFAGNMIHIVTNLAATLMDKLEDNVGSAEQRIGRALLRRASEGGEWRGEDKATLALSRQDLADMTGSTLFTVSRTLSDWQRRGLVALSRGKVVLTDPEGIAEIAELTA